MVSRDRTPPLRGGGRAVAALRHLDAGFWICDDQGRVLFKNDAAARGPEKSPVVEEAGPGFQRALAGEIVQRLPGTLPAEEAPYVDYLVPYRSGEDVAGVAGLRVWTRDGSSFVSELQGELLESLALGASSVQVFERICQLIEEAFEGTQCSVVMLAPDYTLSVVAGPSLDPECMLSLASFVPGLKSGSCGTAVYLGEAVYVRDTESDPRWLDHQDFVDRFQVRASWAQPVFSAGAVVGAVDVSLRHVAEPDPEQVRVMEAAAHIAGLAIQRDQVERALWESERRFQAIFDQAAVGVAQIHTASGRFVRANRYYAETVGLTVPELLSKTTDQVTYEADLGIEARALEQWGAGTSKSLSFEKRLVRSDCTPVWVQMTLSRFWTGNAEPSHHLSVIHDVSERKAAERERRELQQRLLQSQSMESLGHLAGGVAHDFNNQLTVILGNVELLLARLHKDQGPEDAQVLRALGQIRSAGRRSAALTQQLLTHSRRDLEEAAPIDPMIMLQEMHELLPRFMGEQITLELIEPTESLEILADQAQLQLILLNLALNAIDAMPNGGVLRISMSWESKEVGAHPNLVFLVEDSGVGMSEEVRERLFEPLFTTKPLGKGTGLGLSTVHKAVQRIGGKIEVDSELGKGSRFRVEIPVVPGSDEADPQERDARIPRAQGESILLCEDEPLVRSVLSVCLAGAGYSVWEAESAQQAIAKAEELQGEFDLLITDICMPGMSGCGLFSELRRRFPTLPGILISGYASESIEELAGQGEDAFFLRKPIEPKTLLHEVRRVLELVGKRSDSTRARPGSQPT